MGLASSQVTLLMLTARKADCEYDIAIASNRKMSLAREASSLSQEYYQKLNTKNLAYYANGTYNNRLYYCNNLRNFRQIYIQKNGR